MLNLSGQVVIQIRDAETLELIQEIEQKNVITQNMYYDWLAGGSRLVDNIAISPQITPSFEDWAYVKDCIVDGYVPPGVTSPRMVAASGATPPFVELMRRFNAPSSDRTINTIGLPSYSVSSVSYFQSRLMTAYVALSTPCIQTSTQILDVFYRVQGQVSSTKTFNYYNNRPTDILNSIFAGENYANRYVNSNGLLPFWQHAPAESSTAPTTNGTFYNEYNFTASLANVATISRNYDYQKFGKDVINWSLNTGQGVGELFGSMSALFSPNSFYPKESMSTINLDAPNGSKIQPIFSHAAATASQTTATPFLDANPSSGSGTFSLSGDWDSGLLPELYKINIETSGAVGTATYTFSKRHHFGFIGANYHSTAHALPGIFNVRSANDAVPPIQKPHTSVYRADTTFTSRVEKYDETKIISYDLTGVSRYNCATNKIELWDSTTSPVLPVTAISQVSVNHSDGTIWVACRNTGVYQISADGTTVNHFTTAQGLPSNNIHALDIGRGNSIWTVCTGGVASSSNNGASWTVYNTSSTPAFNSPELNSDWGSVAYMRVDPTHADDRICIVRDYNCPINNSTGLVWWSRATATAIPSTFTNYMTDGTSIQSSDFRRYPSAFNVSDNDGIWAIQTQSYTFMPHFGDTTFASSSYANSSIPCIMFVRNEADTQDLLMRISMNASAPVMYGYNQSNNGGPRQTVQDIALLNSSLTRVVWSQVTTNTFVYSSVQSCLDNYGVYVYLGHGVIAGHGLGTSPGKASGGQIGVLNGDGTPSGGAGIEYLIWDKYGWNGSAWVKGYVGAKTTHTGAEDLLHGIKASFTNGAAGTSFIANDYYTASVNDGVLKNNAMTLAGTYNYYVVPTQQLSDFDGVIRAYPWTTGTVEWRKVSASLTVNNDNSISNTLPYRSWSLFAASKNRVFGDFSVSGVVHQLATPNSTQYRIGFRPSIASLLNYQSELITDNFYLGVTGGSVELYGPGGYLQQVAFSGGVLNWNITRVGNTVTMTVGGNSRSFTDSSYSLLVNIQFVDTTNGTVPFTVYPITIDSSDTGYFVGLGNSTNGTGIYDNKQRLTDILYPGDIKVNGTSLLTFSSTPISGSATLAAEDGMLFFAAADAGKTVTGNYVMTYAVTTPCNIIPV